MNKKYTLLALLTIFLIGSAFVSIEKAPNNFVEKPASEDSSPAEGELKWYVDLNEAQAIAKQTNKPIFAFFTGSDWCGWCKRLQATVFHKPSFKAWASENVVLLELDFPRRKQLPENIAAQNNQLKNFFQPRGYPTIWIFDMNLNSEGTQYEINALGNLGYPSGSQPGQEDKKFIANANQILARRPPVPTSASVPKSPTPSSKDDMNVRKRIPMVKGPSGTYKLECVVNGLKMKFIFDTGASSVSLSSTEAVYMLKHNHLTESDFQGKVNMQIADGSSIEGYKVNLKRVNIEGLILENVEATITNNLDAPLLLGQSVLQRFGKIMIDNDNSELIIMK